MCNTAMVHHEHAWNVVLVVKEYLWVGFGILGYELRLMSSSLQSANSFLRFLWDWTQHLNLMTKRVFELVKTELYNSVFIIQNSKHVELTTKMNVWHNFWVMFSLLKTQKKFEFEWWKLGTPFWCFQVMKF